MNDTELTELLLSLPKSPGAKDYRQIARDLIPYIETRVPRLGSGQSWRRLQFLISIARLDLSLARLIEGHLDATQALSEAGMRPDGGALYGIWASGGPADTTDFIDEGKSALVGSKPFCSGSDIVDRALIYIYPAEQLIDVNMQEATTNQQITFQNEHWISAAFQETHTWTVSFEHTPVTSFRNVGESNWYFQRPGFALGALAPAACWAGGALGLVDVVRQRQLQGGHAKAHLGAIMASTKSTETILKWAADQIDSDPSNTSGMMFPNALMSRHLIERACTEIIDRFGRTLGPRPYAFDAVCSRRIAELMLYIRQCHAEADLEELGEYANAHADFPVS